MARSLPVEMHYHRMCGQLSTTCSNPLKQPNGDLLIAIDHNQLRTMASETVDPIDWSHPPPSWAVPLERLEHSINRCSSATALNRSCNLATFSLRGNHIAYAAIQDINSTYITQDSSLFPYMIDVLMPMYSAVDKPSRTGGGF